MQGDNLPVNVNCPIIHYTDMKPVVLRFMHYHAEDKMIFFTIKGYDNKEEQIKQQTTQAQHEATPLSESLH
jgi:hypothetical protein